MFTQWARLLLWGASGLLSYTVLLICLKTLFTLQPIGSPQVEAILKVQKAELRVATEAVFSPSVYVDVQLQKQVKE